jgi:imidazole glycerol-phosphate synthase subunit HisF
VVRIISKRIIPCLDILNGNVVKGKNFENLEYAGDAIVLAKKYYQEGADELVFLDISATNEKRKTTLPLVKEISKNIFIPFTVGGGIKSLDEIKNIISNGADKVSINTYAVLNPDIIKKASKQFGSQAIVIAIDVKKIKKEWFVFINSGKNKTNLKALDWAKEVEKLGAGEIMLTSIDSDGKKKGYDLEITKLISENVNIPVIASGGAGDITDIYDVLNRGKADAALAASIFHYNKYSIKKVKKYLMKNKIKIRK